MLEAQLQALQMQSNKPVDAAVSKNNSHVGVTSEDVAKINTIIEKVQTIKDQA